MSSRIAAAAIAFVFSSVIASAQIPILDYAKNLLNARIAASSGVTWSQGLNGYRVNFVDDETMWVLQLPAGSNWTGYSHVDVRLRNVGSDAADLEFAVGSQNGGGWMTAKAVLAAGSTHTVTMPLKDTVAQGMWAMPSPTDTTAKQLASRGNVVPSSMNGFYIWNKQQRPVAIEVEMVLVTNHTVPETQIVDELGQQRGIAFPGKLASVNDMIAKVGTDPVNAKYPYAADAFGGLTTAPNYGASDRFRLTKDSGRWYLVTPAGNRFFSMGVNEVGTQAFTPVGGREHLFSNLATLQTFSQAWSWREGQWGFYPYMVNVMRKFGTGWENKAKTVFTNRMKDWGFNSLGASSWDSMVRSQDLTSTFCVWMMFPHAKLDMYAGRAISDVFDPSFAPAVSESIKRRFAEQNGLHNAHLGIYFENELPWGTWDRNNVWHRYALGRAALLTPNSASHAYLMSQLRGRYLSIVDLNAAWGTNYSDWSDFETGNTPLPEVASPLMAADLRDFAREFARRYFLTVKQQLRAVGYKGLFLGSRFAIGDYTPEVLEGAKQNTDVLSFNIYNATPQLSNPHLKNLDFPIMITEFAFGANDLGRVGMPLYPTLTEADRIDALKRWFTEIKTWKNVVGAHWYRWEDFPATAKIDGDNMAEGLISITDNPYTEMIDTFRTLNKDFMQFLSLQPSTQTATSPIRRIQPTPSLRPGIRR